MGKDQRMGKGSFVMPSGAGTTGYFTGQNIPTGNYPTTPSGSGQVIVTTPSGQTYDITPPSGITPPASVQEAQKPAEERIGTLQVQVKASTNILKSKSIAEQIKESAKMMAKPTDISDIYGKILPFDKPYILKTEEGKIIGTTISGEPIYEKSKYTYYDPTSYETLRTGKVEERLATKEEIKFYQEEEAKEPKFVKAYSPEVKGAKKLIPSEKISTIISAVEPITTGIKEFKEAYKEKQKYVSETYTMPVYEKYVEPYISRELKPFEEPIGLRALPGIKQISQAEAEFVRGFVKAPFEKPITAGISFATMFAVPPLLAGAKYIGLRGATKYAPGLYYKARPGMQVGGKWLNRLLLGTYGVSVGARVAAAEKPFYELGGITSTEILPMWGGIKAGGIVARKTELKIGLEREVLGIPKAEQLDISSKKIYGEKVTQKQLKELELNIEKQIKFKELPKEKFEKFKEYRKIIETEFGEVKPIRKLPTETIESYEGRKLDKEIADIAVGIAKKKGAIVGGSLAQKAYYGKIKEEFISHDIDVFYGRAKKIWGKIGKTGGELAREIELELKAKGYKEIIRKGAKLQLKGAPEKFLEIHPVEYDPYTHTLKSFGYYEAPVKTPTGEKILSLREQALRKLYGGFLTERASKDIPSLKELMREVYIYKARPKGFPFKKYDIDIKRLNDITVRKPLKKIKELSIKDMTKDLILIGKPFKKLLTKDMIKEIILTEKPTRKVTKPFDVESALFEKIYKGVRAKEKNIYAFPDITKEIKYKIERERLRKYKVPKVEKYKPSIYKPIIPVYKPKIYKPTPPIYKSRPYKPEITPYEPTPYIPKTPPGYKPTPYKPYKTPPYKPKYFPTKTTEKIFKFKLPQIKPKAKAKQRKHYYLAYSPDFTAKAFGIEQKGGRALARRALTKEFTGFETRPLLILPKGLFK